METWAIRQINKTLTNLLTQHTLPTRPGSPGLPLPFWLREKLCNASNPAASPSIFAGGVDDETAHQVADLIEG